MVACETIKNMFEWLSMFSLQIVTAMYTTKFALNLFSMEIRQRYKRLQSLENKVTQTMFVANSLIVYTQHTNVFSLTVYLKLAYCKPNNIYTINRFDTAITSSCHPKLRSSRLFKLNLS